MAKVIPLYANVSHQGQIQIPPATARSRPAISAPLQGWRCLRRIKRQHSSPLDQPAAASPARSSLIVKNADGTIDFYWTCLLLRRHMALYSRYPIGSV